MRLLRWLRANRPDVLHAHLPHATWMARGARLLVPVRAVVDTAHTSAPVPALRRMAYRMTAGLSDRLTAVSGAVAETCWIQRLAATERIAVIPNAIDTHAWMPDLAVRSRVRDELGMTTDDFLWCSVGRLEPVKDHALLLRAFARLPVHAHLALAGAGRLDASLRALAQELGIGARVRFLGFQSDPRRWMQAADGFALTSRWEGLPVSLLEAGACAVPCVATDVPGIREVVQDGITGLLALPRSVESVEQQMARLMAMAQEERTAMGSRARRHIVDRFAMETILDRWECLYAELLTATPRPRRLALPLHGRYAPTPSCVR